MANEKRLTMGQIREREERIWDLSCNGKTATSIGLLEGISRQMVEKILNRVEGRVLRGMAGKIERHKMRQIGQLARVTEIGFDLGKKSQEPRSQVTEKVNDDGQVVKVTQVVEQQGDSKWYYMSMAAMSQAADLLGMKVQPASQEMADTIAAVVQGLKERAVSHKQTSKAIEGEPAAEGTPPANPPRVEGMPAGPEPVQSDDPLPP